MNAGPPVPGQAGDDGWIPVPEQPGGRVLRELSASPEGELREGSIVVRPSLWAAAERSLKVLAGLLALLVPVAIGVVFGVDADGPEPSGPEWLRLADLSMTLVFPLFAAIAPAVQLAFTRYVLDDEGIRERVQILSKTERRVSWDKVTALRHRRTLLDRAVGLGRLDVIAYGERGTTIHLVGLREAPDLRGLVARRMREAATVERLLGND